MEQSIDQILDLASKFLIDEYGFIDPFIALRFVKADQDHRIVQLLVKGSFRADDTLYPVPEVALTVYADATYEEAIARTLEEMKNPSSHTRWAIEGLIIKPCIEEVETIEVI